MQRIGAVLAGPADFPGWRDQARRLLAAEVPPEAVEWRVPGDQPGLFGTAPVPGTPPATPAAKATPPAGHSSASDDRPPSPAADVPEGGDHRRPFTGHSSESADRPPCPVAAVSEGGDHRWRSAVHSSESGNRPPFPAGHSPENRDRCLPPAEHSSESGDHRLPPAGDSPESDHRPPLPACDAADDLPPSAGDPSESRDQGGLPTGISSEAGAPVRAPARPADSPERGGPVRCSARPTDSSEGRAPARPDDASGTCDGPRAPAKPGDLSESDIPSGVPTGLGDVSGRDGPTRAPTRPDDLSENGTLSRHPGRSAPVATVPRAFLDLAETAVRHRDPERFALLYRALWRLTHGEPALLRVATDPDVSRLEAMAKAVRRDAHKMHAFVRFRRIETGDGPRYVSWFEPEHHILEAEAGFFVRRFAGMRWSILTPGASAHWDGAALATGPGARRSDAPPEDAHEDLWRAYYASVFNPARLKPGAMRAEMPVKYWRNLPEAREIPRLIAEAPRRAAAMVERGPSAPALRRQRAVHLPPPPAAAAQPVAASGVTAAMPAADLFAAAAADPAEALAALRAEMLALNSLPPWTADATQMVFGEGPVGAPLLFVGEQPGDEEDIAGRPFVGPAGRMFNKAAEEAGIDRAETYVTNAVKHFKFKPTGRRRLHQSPDAGDIAYYRPFLKREIDLVGPELVVTLGATALRALSGKPLAINKTRGEVIPMADGPPIFATVHPSYLLRLPDPDSKAREYERFVSDLKRAKREVA